MIHPAYAILFAILMFGKPPGTAGAANGPSHDDLVTARIERRIVKTFDFDERKLGNYEELPMNWHRLTGPGRLRFLELGFDDEIGHAAPPSFRLGIRGGSIGAQYIAKDIPVKSDSDYRITAWIQTTGLTHARASVTAYFLDHAFRKIPSTERASRLVGGDTENDLWVQVSVDLPGGTEEAAWLGLSCRLDQPDEAAPRPDDPRPLNTHDVHGAAWFDDLAVIRLPQTSLELQSPAPLFFSDRPAQFLVRVVDPDGVGLSARLDILDCEDHAYRTRALRAARKDQKADLVGFEDLPVGLYSARLVVSAGAEEIISLRRGFVCLPPDPVGKAAAKTPALPVRQVSPRDQSVLPAASRIGLQLDVPPVCCARATQDLLRAVSPGAVKLRVWDRDTDDAAIVRGNSRVEAVLHNAHDLGIPVVGVLAAAPPSLAVQESGPSRDLVQVLSSPPDEWRPYLTLPLARHGRQIAAWQVGGDDDGRTFGDPRFPQAVANFCAEFRPLLGAPSLIAPLPSESRQIAIPAEVDVLAMNIPWHIAAERIPELLGDRPDTKRRPSWLTLQSPPDDRYPRRARLVEYARRLIAAYGGGADRVFLPQPWCVEKEGEEFLVKPAEEIILLRTLSQALDGCTGRREFWLDHGLRAWLFEDETSGKALIAAWTEGDGLGPRQFVADLGEQARRIDLWGNVESPPTVAGGREITLDAMPVLIGPTPLWRARMLAQYRLNDGALQVAVEPTERVLRIANPTPRPLRAALRLYAPDGWNVNPARAELNLAPGESAALPVSFRLPANQGIGEFTLIGRLTFDGPDGGQVTLRAPLHVNCPGLDVSLLTEVAGAGLNLVQRVTNLTDESISLRTYLVAPGAPTNSHTIVNLAAGQSAVREYHIEDARPLRGTHLRVTTQQLGGPLRSNHVIRFDGIWTD